jgi:RNA polymerase sigma-B factor
VSSVRYESVEPLFRELATAPPSHRCALRNRLVTAYLPVAEHLAERFDERGESLEDLRQVAVVGLIHAVDRFDVTRGSDFMSFAVPTILGELRRHFRDLSWALRVPRRLKNLIEAIDAASVALGHRLGRSPTPSEVAVQLAIGVDEVYEGLHARQVAEPDVLDDALAETVGAEDPALEDVDNHQALKPMLRGLPKRERRIVVLRFFGNMSQSEIALRVGISQMHVSRLLAKSLAQLRQDLVEEG